MRSMVATRAGEPELGVPEPRIFEGAGAGALICIYCGAGAGAINEMISPSSKWLKNLTKTSLSFLAQKNSLLLTSLDVHKIAGMSETKKV